MSILSCFLGGAGGVKLHVKAYAAVGSLPASGKEGAIAVITQTAIGDVYASADAPGTPANGDVWAWLGGVSLAPVVLSESITLHPRAVYQYNGSAWVLKASYVYTGSAWVEVSLMIYDNGEEILSTSSVTAIGLVPTAVAFTFESARIKVVAITGGSAAVERQFLTDYVIDLTDVSSVKVKTSIGSGFSRARDLIVATSRTVSAIVAAQAIAEGTLNEATLDVSALSGEYYIGFRFGINGTYVTATGYIYEVELLR